MTDWVDDSERAAMATPPAGSPVAPVGAHAEPGWYPDPWTGDHHRYWNGTAWTAHAFHDGPAGRYAPDRPTTSTLAAQWGPDDLTQANPTTEWSDPPTETDWRPGPPPGPAWKPVTKSDWPPTGPTLVLLLLLLVLVVGGISMGATYLALRRPSRPAAQATLPTAPGPTTPGQPTTPSTPSTPGAAPTTPAPPPDPAATALTQMVVNQGDVPSTVSVQALVGGDQVSGQTTLDICNGTFASESLRSARLQVAVVDTQDATPISTEAVAYRNPAATAQAFAELKTVAAKCPSTPVVSPVGEPTVATKFNAAPDAAWPQVAGVDRMAFDFVTTDSTGQTHHSVAVYLRRGRLLMGVYFSQPDTPQIAVNGQTTIPAVVNIFAGRMAAQPAAVANGG